MNTQIVFFQKLVSIKPFKTFNSCPSVSIFIPTFSLLFMFNILERFLQQIYLNDFKNTIITIHVDNPYGYGRIVLEKNKIVNIVEEKDASEEERKINLINTGIYCFDASYLCYLVPQIENNNIQKEYYLTDIVKIGNSKNIIINNITLLEAYNNNVLGVNTKKELDSLELNAM